MLDKFQQNPNKVHIQQLKTIKRSIMSNIRIKIFINPINQVINEMIEVQST
jgi:hypothetical protein